MRLADSHPPAPDRPPLLVLGVEQEWSARSLETVLGPNGFAIVRAASGREAIKSALTMAPDAVLIDSRLSDLDGIEVCRALRAPGGVGPHVPIVLITSGAAPREFMREAYQAGVWSVWEQPMDGELLIMRLQTWIDAKRAVDAAQRTQLIDPTSGLYTYVGLHRRSTEILAEARRRNTPVTCVALSVVASALRSESLERALPDQILADVAQLLSGTARTSDAVGQLGPREYAILAPCTEGVGADRLVHRIHAAISQLPPFVEDAQLFQPVVRAGLATVSPQDLLQTGAPDLLRRASTALRFAHASRSAETPTYEEVPASFV